MERGIVRCEICRMEVGEDDIIRHKIRAHGDVNAVKYLPAEQREEMLKKVTVRNLYLSEVSLDIIALQVDLDVPSVLKIIEEIKKEWTA